MISCKYNLIRNSKMLVFRKPLTGLNTSLIDCICVALKDRCLFTIKSGTCKQGIIYFNYKIKFSMPNACSFGNKTHNRMPMYIVNAYSGHTEHS